MGVVHIAREADRRKHKIRQADSGAVYMGTRKLSLGRRKSKADPRDYPYEMPSGARTFLRAATQYYPKYWWDLGWQGDQGASPHCVAYSALHRIENSPRTHPTPGPVADPRTFYSRAQQIDEWPGEAYDGTSVRAGAKVARELGFISEFRRIATMDELKAAIALEGPVILGTYWYYSMFNPRYLKSADGKYRWTVVVDAAEGGIAGGHAYLANGINFEAQTIRILNSWGPTWGVEGRATLTFATAERLVFAEEGEAFVYKEV